MSQKVVIANSQLCPRRDGIYYFQEPKINVVVLWSGLWDDHAKYLQRTKKWCTAAHDLLDEYTDQQLLTEEKSAYFASREEAIAWCKNNGFEYELRGDDWWINKE